MVEAISTTFFYFLGMLIPILFKKLREKSVEKGSELNIDKFKNHLPSHEVANLKRKIEEISKFDVKGKKKKSKIVKDKKDKKVEKKKVTRKSSKPVFNSDKEDVMGGALASEKKELELLRKDLESISKELDKRK